MSIILSKIEYRDRNDILNKKLILNIENEINNLIKNDDTYSLTNLNNLEREISNFIIE